MKRRHFSSLDMNCGRECNGASWLQLIKKAGVVARLDRPVMNQSNVPEGNHRFADILLRRLITSVAVIGMLIQSCVR